MADTLVSAASADTLVADTSADTQVADTPVADIHQCGICQCPLVGVTPEPVESLLCGHPFHGYCIHKYAETMCCTLANLACPMCRRVSSDIEESGAAHRAVEASLGSINVDSQDDDRDPSAAGSNDPIDRDPATYTAEYVWHIMRDADATQLAASDAAAIVAHDGVSSDGMPAAVMPSNEMSAGAMASDDTPTPGVADGGMPAVPVPDPDMPDDDDMTLANGHPVKGNGKAGTPADGKGIGKAGKAGTPADGKGKGKAGKGKAGKAGKGKAGRGGKGKAGRGEPDAEPANDSGISAEPANDIGSKGNRNTINAALSAALFADREVFCSRCGGMALASRCRIKSKGQLTWQCDKCAVKLVQLHRSFGSTMPPELASLSEARQQEFFAAEENIAEKVSRELMTIEESGSYFECGGQLLPLGVWRTKGYDAEAIETKSEAKDKAWHPVLGDTYRVRLIAKGERKWSGEKTTATAAAKSSSKKRKALPPIAVEKVENETADPSQSDNHSSDSSSSSNSSSSDKKKRKNSNEKKKKKSAQKSKASDKKKRKDKGCRKGKEAAGCSIREGSQTKESPCRAGDLEAESSDPEPGHHARSTRMPLAS